LKNKPVKFSLKVLKNVIISMAGDGALLVTPEAEYFAKPLRHCQKFCGCSDSMVAGFTVNMFNLATQSKPLNGCRMWNSNNILR
jgi:fructose-1-phosphate kinase PfkB-like protein